MPLFFRSWLALGLALSAVSQLSAQSIPAVDKPARADPVKPVTRAELDRLEAVKLYGLAVIHEKNNRLLEAVKAYEEARRLDPDAAPPRRALISLYIALDRTEDALTECRRVLEIDPDDGETAYKYARQLRILDRPKDAVAVLAKAAASAALKEKPELRAQICFDLGLLYEKAGTWQKAEKAFREVADVLEHPAALLEQGVFSLEEINSQAADTYERLGRICLKAGQHDKAVAAFQQAQKKDPGRAARLSFNLAEVHESKGQFSEALKRLDEYLRTRPSGGEGYELKIKLLRKLDREGEVLGALKEAATKDDQNHELKLLLAREYRAAGQTNDAKAVYTELLKDEARSEAYKGLFALYKQERDGVDKILGMLDDAVRQADPRAKDGQEKPGNPVKAAHARTMLQALRDDGELVKLLLTAAHRRLLAGSRLEFSTSALLGSLAAHANQLEVAEELYRSCFKRPGGLREMEAEAYAGLVSVLMQRHKYQEAIAVCNEGLQKAQLANRVWFHRILTEAHLALSHDKEALEAADDAVKEAPEAQQLAARCRRAIALARTEKCERAVAECKALLKEYNQPGEIREIRSTLSSVYSFAREHAKAEEQLLLILRDDPNDASANNDLGYFWADQGKNLAEAEKRIRKALELDRQQRTGTFLGVDADRDNAAYVDSLGWVLFRRGKLDEARKELERAVAMPGGDDDPVVWDHLGDVYARLDQARKAEEAWRKALALYKAGTRRRDNERQREIEQKLRPQQP
jgi:tetratricopeptide (TPR) repeat protein